jgi:hypothetical protein
MVHLAVKIRGETDAQQTKTFSADQSHRILRGANLTGAYFFWESLQQVVTPDSETSLCAEVILRVLAESLYAECHGEALSPQRAEIFRHFGLTPIRSALPMEYASC